MFSPKFSVPPNTLDVKTFLSLRCKNGTDLLHHHAKYGGAGVFAAMGGAKKVGTATEAPKLAKFAWLGMVNLQ